MRYARPAAAAIVALCLSAIPASAKLLIEIDKSVQRMTVSEDGTRLFAWPVSTGTRAYDTPSGTFTPFRMEKDHFSREWDDAPMPNSIFFTKQGHAIHGTTHTSIGRPASHGCVRLGVEHSRVLFDLVKREGMNNVRVVLFGETPGRDAPAVARRAPDYRAPDYPGSIDPRDPGYVSPPDADARDNGMDNGMFAGSPPRQWRNDRSPRRGTWVLRRDGSWVFYDSEGYEPPPPAPPFAVRPWGFN